ncbi:MAG: hypothetical protein EOP85_01400, partial [Verrucomicrobiaceae bacterium]
MKSRRPAVLIATHAAALCAGLMFFRPPSQAQGGPLDIDSRESPAASSEMVPAAGESGRPRRTAESPVNSSTHRAAWKVLAHQGLPRPERMKASAVILRGWIRDDWREALDAAMGETPDDFSLLAEFQDTFVREPEAAWQLIEEKRYGVLTRAVRKQWITAVGREDDATLKKLIETLPVSAK